MNWPLQFREVIDLCSTNSDSSTVEDNDLIFSPVKPKVEIEDNLFETIKQVIPNVNDNDYHDPEQKLYQC